MWACTWASVYVCVLKKNFWWVSLIYVSFADSHDVLWHDFVLKVIHSCGITDSCCHSWASRYHHITFQTEMCIGIIWKILLKWFCSFGLGWGLGFCISNKPQSDALAASLRRTLSSKPSKAQDLVIQTVFPRLPFGNLGSWGFRAPAHQSWIRGIYSGRKVPLG